jgi:hypothetical protein
MIADAKADAQNVGGADVTARYTARAVAAIVATLFRAGRV